MEFKYLGREAEYMRDYNREWRKSHPESVRATTEKGKAAKAAQRAQARVDNPDHARTRDALNNLNRKLRRFGLTREQYNDLAARGCRCCGGPPVGGRNYFSLDHDHATGKFRGLLCNLCNTALGLLKEDPERIEKLNIYAETLCAAGA